MLKIDAHQHFWVYEPKRDNWITEDMAVLKQDFLPGQLQEHLRTAGFSGSVVVQSAQSEEENSFQLNNALSNDFIKGVVGWTDFNADHLSERLEKYAAVEKLKGFRHMLQGENDRALMLSATFKSGLRQLLRYGYTYDLLLLPDQLGFAETLMREFSDQPFVLDHLGKPEIKNGRLEDWARTIRALARHEQVYCKVSGMVTEADLLHWKENDFRPYLDVIFEAFGSKRVMFGSDWPVCLLAASYDQVITIMENYMLAFSPDEKALFWGENANRFYQLKL